MVCFTYLHKQSEGMIGDPLPYSRNQVSRMVLCQGRDCHSLKTSSRSSPCLFPEVSHPGTWCSSNILSSRHPAPPSQHPCPGSCEQHPTLRPGYGHASHPSLTLSLLCHLAYPRRPPPIMYPPSLGTNIQSQASIAAPLGDRCGSGLSTSFLGASLLGTTQVTVKRREEDSPGLHCALSSQSTNS